MPPLRNSVLACLLALAGPASADPSVAVPTDYRQSDYRAPVPDSVPGGGVVDVAGVKAAAASGAVLVDVLPAPRQPEASTAPWLPPARRDIPGSVWLSDVGRGTLTPRTEAWFAGRLDALSASDRARPLVFYCLRDCWMSWNAARRAAALGYTAVSWFPGGTDAWAEAGGPTQVATPEFAPER